MAIYRRVNESSGKLNGGFVSEAGYIKFGTKSTTLRKAHLYHLYPVIEPDYDPDTHVVSDLYFKESTNPRASIVTRSVHEFRKGIANNWKDQVFVGGELLRPIRVRVARKDTLKGVPRDGVLEAMASNLLKTNAPFFLVDANGNIDANGLFIEAYLVEVDAGDAAALQSYVEATEGAVLEYYKDL